MQLKNTERMLNKNNKYLFFILLKLDFRDKKNSGFKKIFGIILSTMIATTILSYSNFSNFDKDSFIFISVTIIFLFAILFVLSDFTNLYYSSNYNELLSILPIKNKDFYLIKFLTASVYFSIILLGMIIPPTIFIYFYKFSIIDSLYFFIFSMLFVYSVIFGLVTVYSMFILITKAKLKIILYIFQMFFIFFVFYINKITMNAYSKNIFDNLTVLNYLPQYFIILSIKNPINSILIFTVFIITFFIAISLFIKYYKPVYNILYKDTETNFKRDKKKITFFDLSNLIRNNTESASFYLIKKLFANSNILKLRITPIILIPIASFLILFITSSSELLMKSIADMPDSIKIIHPSLSIPLIMSIRLFIGSTKSSIEEKSAFNYSLLPINNLHLLKKGIIKFGYYYFYFPILLLFAIILSFTVRLDIIILNYLYLVPSIILINSVLNIKDKILPFSMDNNFYNIGRKYFDILIATLLGIISFVIQMFIFQNIVFVLITIFLFIILNFIINSRINKKPLLI